MKFNSQICTTREQSERLLALGLKTETADMYWGEKWGLKDGEVEPYFTGEYIVCVKQPNMWIDCQSTIPAWSLHRLVYLSNKDNIKIAFNEKDCWGGNMFSISQRKAFKNDNLYDNLIDCIEWLIKEGDFNKEYLVNQTEFEKHIMGVLEYLDYIIG